MDDTKRQLQKLSIRSRIIPFRKEELEGSELLEELSRPRVRADCVDVPRPCPFVGCRYNLFLDVSSQGALKSNFLEWEPDVLDPSMCALDYAEQGGLKLEEIGRICNLTRERVRQIEAHAMQYLARKKEFTEFGEPPSGIRRVL